jgi:hypothetical protein
LAHSLITQFGFDQAYQLTLLFGTIFANLQFDISAPQNSAQSGQSAQHLPCRCSPLRQTPQHGPSPSRHYLLGWLAKG